MMEDKGRLEIRSATAGDRESILTIERLSFPVNSWDFDSFLYYDCFVAEIEGQIAGFLVSRELIGNQNNDGEREILNLAVHPARRRRRIAEALLKQELARGGTFYLEVRESNLAARRLYEGLGFEAIGRRDGYYADPSESAIVMKRKE